MSFVKYATAEILETKTSKTRLPFEYGAEPGSTFQKFAALEDTGDSNGYLYVRTRAISSRVNKNNDGWPSEELAKGYKTFVGRPLFVDHNNDDHKRTRGVVLDARLFVDEGEKTSALDPYYSSAPAAHLPPTHIETISEVDAQTFPKLAEAIRTGKVNSVSMGANIETSVCSVCENRATTPKQYCSHIKSKGNEFEVTSADGSVTKRKAYEDCYGVNFFEQSFVFDPADETALFSEPVSEERMVFAKAAALANEPSPYKPCGICGKPCHYIEYTDGSTGWEHNNANVDLDHDARVDPQLFESKVAAGLKTDVKQPGDEDKDDAIKNKFPDGEKPNTKKPQSDSLAAPERVDTLENDLICPNCESDNLEEDPDGIYRCPTCEYELPPDGFRSPDLEEAREMDIRQKVDSEKNEDGDEETGTEPDSDDVTFEDNKKNKGLGPVSPVSPLSKTINNNKSNGIISEMNWNTKPENVDFVVKYLEKTARVQNLDNENTVARHLLQSYGRDRLMKASITRLEIAEGIEKFAMTRESASDTVTLPKAGIHAGSVGIFKQLGLQGTATYHNAGPFAERFDELPENVKVGLTKSGNDIVCDLNTVNPPLTQGIGMACAEARGDGQCEVTLDVTPDQALPYAIKLFEASGNGPVWKGVEEALQNGDGPKAMQLMMTAASKPVKRKPINPRQPQSTKDEKIVSDQLKPVEADRRVIKREESDDSGTKRTETIVEETGELGGITDEPKAEEKNDEPKAESQEDTSAESTQAEPEANEESSETEEETERPWERKKEPAYASVEETEEKSESNLLLAMEAAKLASSLGVIPTSEELSYAAELESKSEDVIRDRLETLGNLKTAGVLQKQARFTSVPQVPRLGHTNGSGTPEQKIAVEDYLSEIFI